MIRLIIFLIVLIPILSQSQNLVILKYNEQVVGDAISENAIFSYASIKNVSDKSINVRVKRIDGNYNELTDENAICWGSCYLPAISVTNSLEIGPGEIDSMHFTGHVYPDRDGIPRQGEINYVFFNESDTNDFAEISVLYIVEIFTGNNFLNTSKKINVYPNPANDYIIFDLENGDYKNLNISLYDMNGKSILHSNYKQNTNHIRLNISNINGGLYFYSIRDGFNTLFTNKIIIE